MHLLSIRYFNKIKFGIDKLHLDKYDNKSGTTTILQTFLQKSQGLNDSMVCKQFNATTVQADVFDISKYFRYNQMFLI